MSSRAKVLPSSLCVARIRPASRAISRVTGMQSRAESSSSVTVSSPVRIPANSSATLTHEIARETPRAVRSPTSALASALPWRRLIRMLVSRRTVPPKAISVHSPAPELPVLSVADSVRGADCGPRLPRQPQLYLDGLLPSRRVARSQGISAAGGGAVPFQRFRPERRCVHGDRQAHQSPRRVWRVVRYGLLLWA